MSFRVGIGFDIHRLVKGRDLVLAGVNVPSDKGLLGHSDGDVITHAVCDALLGAVGSSSDIGSIFPDTAEETLGMNSLDMLKSIASDIHVDYSIVNMDINCICERPALAPFRDKMIKKIADTCGISTDKVSIKFRTNEGLGDVGKGNAISSQAIVLVERRR